MQTNILSLNSKAAKKYFLRSDCYCNFDLPEYYEFSVILKKINVALGNKPINSIINTSQKPDSFEDVNYRIIVNKDGHYSWRPFQLIHPVLYLALVNEITESSNWTFLQDKFRDFAANSSIECASISLVPDKKKTLISQQILNWWEHIEQRSIELSLEYRHIFVTDISNCYSAMYTHSIPWALHEKNVAKKNRKNSSLLGNKLDSILQKMSFGQTNGIPQGSNIMDFIAEIILGYIDLEIGKKINSLKITNYKIIRYRDDYKIFVNDCSDGEKIVKSLTEVLIGFGLQLNSSKTISSSDVISNSIKKDKLHLITNPISVDQNNQKRLLEIYQMSKMFPNSGSIKRALIEYNKTLKITDKDRIMPMISITTDLAYNNPVVYSVASAIISKLLKNYPKEKVIEIIKMIIKKFENRPNSAFIDIWMQRITFALDNSYAYSEKLTHAVTNTKISLWNSSWISDSLLKKVMNTPIVDANKLKRIRPIIPNKEVDKFMPVY